MLLLSEDYYAHLTHARTHTRTYVHVMMYVFYKNSALFRIKYVKVVVYILQK